MIIFLDLVLHGLLDAAYLCYLLLEMWHMIFILEIFYWLIAFLECVTLWLQQISFLLHLLTWFDMNISQFSAGPVCEACSAEGRGSCLEDFHQHPSISSWIRWSTYSYTYCIFNNLFNLLPRIIKLTKYFWPKE